jgi:hypothetical protein
MGYLCSDEDTSVDFKGTGTITWSPYLKPLMFKTSVIEH